MEGKNAVIYARFSSDKQREESIEGQVRECKAFAAANDLAIIDVYIDRALSARTDKRPGFLQMIADSGKHLFDYVIVYQLDRFSRSRYDSAIYKQRLKKNGVRVLSAKENIKDDPSGIILESVLEGYAEYYSAELSQKVQRGMMENFLEKKWNGGTVPFGYTVDKDKRFVPDPNTSQLIPTIFNEVLAGKTLAAIARSLTEQGYRTRFGKPLTTNMLSHVIRNPIYIGSFTWQGHTCEDFAPPLIRKEVFAAMQALLNSRKRGHVVRRGSKYALTGKIYCGYCGLPMTGYSGKSHTGTVYHYYHCSSKNNHYKKAKQYHLHCEAKRVQRDFIEDVVLKTTIRILTNPAALHFIAEQAAAVQKQDRKQEDGNQHYLECHIKDVEKRLKNCVNAVENGLVSQIISNHIAEYEKELSELKKALSTAKLKEKAFTITDEAVEFYLQRLVLRTKDGKCALNNFQDFIRRVVVTEDQVDIYYNYHGVPQVLENPAVIQLPGSNKSNLVGPLGFEPRTNRL